jgi:hypothetical protein
MPVTLNDVLNFIDREEPEYGLGAALGDEALPVLADLITGENEALAVKAASLASAIGTPAAATLLGTAIATAGPAVKVATAVGLRRFKPEMTAPILTALANDPDIGIRKLARTTLFNQQLALSLAFVNWTAADAHGATGSLHQHGVELVGTMGTAFALHNEYTGFNSDAFTPPLTATDMVEISAGPGSGHRYTLSFGAPVREPVLHLGSLGSIIEFDSDIVLTRLSGNNGFAVDGSKVVGQPRDPHVIGEPSDSYGTVRLSGEFSLISFTVTPKRANPTAPDGIFLQCGGSGDPHTLLAHRAALANALHMHTFRLMQAGQIEEARAASRRTIEAYREVAGTAGADVAEVARQLLVFSSDLSQGQLLVESAVAAEAAVGVLRAVQPSTEAQLAHRAALANALHMHTFRLMQAGQIEEARAASRRTIEAYREVAGTAGADVAEVARQLLVFSSDLSQGQLLVESAVAAEAAADIGVPE